MHPQFCKRGALVACLAALVLTAVVPSVAAAGPEPGKKRGFRLFAGALGALTVNRIYCGLNSAGEICVDSLGSSTIGGGSWPRGTANQYVFNSGLQVAGIIGPDGGPWAGNTTGAFFFNARGGSDGEEVQPIYNAGNPDDVANWPAAGLVPTEPVEENNLFNPLLRGRVSASQGDIWYLAWDGNPAQIASRPHPLGLLVETRGLGWNFPPGNEDILYFTYTFYNVSSADPATYANVRPEMRDILIEKGAEFQAENEAAFGVDLPNGGYTLTNLFAAFGADMDVADAGSNYSSVNLPFALGYTYEHTFGQAAGWTFDPGIFGSPFFAGTGFVGVKYLRSPTGAGEIQLFSNTLNAAVGFRDATSAAQLYRYLSGTLGPTDEPCSHGPAATTHICFINSSAADSRFYQSSTPLTLAPGEFGSIVVAYIFAAPVAVPGFNPPVSDQPPGDPRLLSNVTALEAGNVNTIDRLSGFVSYTDDPPTGNADGVAQQSEFTVVPGSLLGKSLVAQAVFDNRFLLPFAPEPPQFFLVPGNGQVTVLWQPSTSETTGDPFFAIANAPTQEVVNPETGVSETVPNPLYDPNYRQSDVEGYRIYRGRTDSPNEFQLLAQFDYSGTLINDFAGQVNPIPECAPEIDIVTACPVVFDPVVAGQARTQFVSYPLVGNIIQTTVAPGGSPARIALANGLAFVTSADTAVVGGDSELPPLADNGVPFAYADPTVRNNFRYFYAVVAFDVNSFQSGPSSLESARLTRSTTPVATASDVVSSVEFTGKVLSGRGTPLDVDAPVPAIDPATGTFSGPFPAANAWGAEFNPPLSAALGGSGSFSFRLDSIQPGNYWHDEPHVFWYTGTGPTGETTISMPVVQSFVEPSVEASSLTFPAASLGPNAEKFGGSTAFALPAQVEQEIPGGYFMIGWGRGAAFGPQSAGFENVVISEFNGPRWFSGAAEPPNPVANNAATPTTFEGWSNAGALPGVSVIHAPRAYLQGYGGVDTRDYEGVLGPYVRAADYNVYWGAAGLVDSVIDLTHNVAVEFDPRGRAGWGLLTTASVVPATTSVDAAPGVMTFADFMCTEAELVHAAGGWACTGVDPYPLVTTAALGPVAIANTPATLATAAAAVPAGQQGFGIYMPGHFFLLETDAIPAAGTVWTLRSYIGAFGGGGADPYVFHPAPRPLTAVGTVGTLEYSTTNTTNVVSADDLSRVHTVPDPYYVTNEFEQSTDNKIIKFVNLPSQAIIRIYSSSGVLVQLLEHTSSTLGGSLDWNVRNRNNQVVASGVYFYHLESGGARRVGRFTVVNFAQ